MSSNEKLALRVELFKKWEKALNKKCHQCGEIQARLLSSLSSKSSESETLSKKCQSCQDRFVETVLLEVPGRCKFAKFGCGEILMKEELKNHELLCKYYAFFLCWDNQNELNLLK